MDTHKIELNGDTIHLKKGIFGWGVVNPIKNGDGSINWFNLIIGSWFNLLMVGCIVMMCLFFYLAWGELSSQAVSCLEQVQQSNLYLLP